MLIFELGLYYRLCDVFSYVLKDLKKGFACAKAKLQIDYFLFQVH